MKINPNVLGRYVHNFILTLNRQNDNAIICIAGIFISTVATKYNATTLFDEIQYKYNQDGEFGIWGSAKGYPAVSIVNVVSTGFEIKTAISATSTDNWTVQKSWLSSATITDNVYPL